MSLNYDLRNVLDYETKLEDLSKAQIVDTLIWLSMPLGFREITADNVDLIHARLKAYEHVGGPVLKTIEDGVVSPRDITREDIAQWVGMSTNATVVNRAGFNRTLIRAIENRIGRSW